MENSARRAQLVLACSGENSGTMQHARWMLSYKRALSLDNFLFATNPESARTLLCVGAAHTPIQANAAPEEYRMNADQLKGKWTELKGSVRERWGKLTNDDIEVIAGQHDQLIGRIQNRYGIAKEEAQRQVEEWMKMDDFSRRKAG